MRKLFALSGLASALLVAPAFANDLDVSASKGGEITYASSATSPMAWRPSA